MIPALQVDNVCKRFGDVIVLKDVSVKIRAGEILVLLGQSGSGKSTLAHIICGSSKPDSGRVLVNGRVITSIDPELPISFMPQELGYWTSLTVRQQISLIRRSRRAWYHDDFSDSAIASILRFDSLMDAQPTELSGGELRRLAFFRALLLKCALAIFDEPFSSIDVATEAQMQAKLREFVQEQGCAVLLITHSFEHALLLGHRAAVLHDGRIVQDGDPTDMVKAPIHGAVAKALGTFNVWPATLPENSGELVATREGEFPMPNPRTECPSYVPLAYVVPHNAMRLGNGYPGVQGVVEYAVPVGRGVRIGLKDEKNRTRVQIGMQLSEEILVEVRKGTELRVHWDSHQAMLLPD